LNQCSQCHGTDYSGGLVSSSCNTCHSGSNGPESCNTCHGDFSDESRIAPPKDLSDNIETSARGVGAHSTHLYDNMVSAELSCTDCHPEVQTDDNYVFAHINGLPAEIAFGDLASQGGSDPVYNTDLSCANTYCHGNFDFNGIMGNNFSPVWNIVDGTQGACGTCHGKDGTPAPQGHFGNFEADDCVTCHSTTFNEDGSLNKLTHINGEANFN
jgi:predicted CxxxxCH...CXXCH cytochrome family protein